MKSWIEFWDNSKKVFQERCCEEQRATMCALDDARNVQWKVLKDILELNSNTVFGKEYDFRNIEDIDGFRAKVPISNYEGYRKWIDKEIEEGGGVLNASKILRYLKTSGTTGKNKAIPFTQYWMEKSRTPALYALWGNYYKYDMKIFNNPYSVLDLSTVREHVSDYLNGVPYQSISNRNVVYNEHDWKPCWYEAPWFNENVPEDYDEKMYFRIRYFIGQDLRIIVSINPSTLLALYRNIKDNKKRLIKDIRMGTLCNKKIFTPNTKLAQVVESIILKAGFNMNELWPNLKIISAWTASSTELYLTKIRELYPLADVLPYMACGSEGIVAIPVDSSLKAAPLAVKHGFYEFVPAEKNDIEVYKNPTNTLLFNELEEGKNYQLIMSQANGLMRYMPGDIYKVVGFYKDVPKLEFVTRTNTFFSFTGEKITEEQILESVNNTCNKLMIQKGLFFFSSVWDEIPYYKLYLEIPANRIVSEEEIEAMFDTELRKVNYEFDSKRVSGRLGSTEVICLKYGVIDAYIEKQKAKGNGVQFKYKPFVKDDSSLEDLLCLNKEDC